MKKYEAILFDLDGTLLPMNMDSFSRGYLHTLAEEMKKYGYSEQTLLPAMWKGVASMVKNDGTRTNSAAFWETFSNILGKKTYDDIPHFDAFYGGRFNEAVKYTEPTPNARKAVEYAKSCADKVILATNPMFPTVAVKVRLEWTGLKYEDFDFATDYENSHYCKPNPKYFSEIAEKFSLTPKNCLMVGNNTEEDIKASAAAGFSAFLLTDCLICDGEMPNCPKGSFTDLFEFLNNGEKV